MPAASNTSTTELRKVWTPLKIGPVTIRNRIAMPPISTYYSSGAQRFINERHIAYYRERAYGGVGLIVTEQQLAHSVTNFRSGVLIVWDERAIPHLEEAGKAVHEQGAKLFAELLIPGAWDTGVSSLEDWHVAKAPSRMFLDYLGEYVDELTKDDIKQMYKDFARSADNVRRAGLDGVDIHGTHGYLAEQFMSRHYNKRTDEYGGTPKNRIRFVIEAGQAIRDKVGGDIAVGIRLSIEEFKGDAGLQESEVLEMLDLVAAERVYDFFDISCGGLGMVHTTISPMGTPDAFLEQQGMHVKEVVGDRAKVILVGRIRDLATAERLVSEGAADMVHMGRALLADPLLPRKTMEGQKDEIIRCIGITNCSGQPMTNCALNPITGRERQWGAGKLAPAKSKKRVVVIGGGPAGLKAAGVAATRGHSVVLLERQEQLGGMMNLLKQGPTRGDWQFPIDDMTLIATRRGVDIRLGVDATAEAIKQEKPDAVICATGSNWSLGTATWTTTRDGVAILDGGSALAKFLDDTTALGHRVAIVDETGTYMPLGLSEMLRGAGVEAFFITSRGTPTGMKMNHNDTPYLMPRLRAAGVNFVTNSRIDSIEKGSLCLANNYMSTKEELPNIDSVVVFVPKVPSDALYRQIEGTYPETFVIGDALSPRMVREAVYEGEKTARML